MNPNVLNQVQGLELVSARLGAHVAARAILRRGERPEGVERLELAEGVRAALAAESAGVMGNRGGCAPVTWDDARLLLAATLRNCLNLLEGER